MKQRFAAFGLAVAFAAATASAQQQGTLSGPVMGFLSDASGAFYRVDGLPGASRMAKLGAAATAPPGSVKFSKVSQQGRLALIAAGGNDASTDAPSQLYLTRGLDRLEPEVFQLSGAMAGPSLAAFCTATGDTAVLYSESAGALQFVRGLRSGEPETLAPVVISNLGRLSALACHEAARSVVFAAGETGNQGLYTAALKADGFDEPRLAGPVGSAVAIAPYEHGLSSLVLDASGNRLLMAVHGSGGMVESIGELAGAADGINQPVGVAITESGLAAVASAGTPSVLVYNVRNRQAAGAPLELPAAPTQCERLLAGDVFALTSPRAGAPLYTIDLAAEPRVVFTPAYHGDSQQ